MSLVTKITDLSSRISAEFKARSWTYYVSTWTSAPSLLGSATVSSTLGTVYSYTLAGTTRYRFVPDIYDASKDAFYTSFTNGTLTGLIVKRG